MQEEFQLTTLHPPARSQCLLQTHVDAPTAHMQIDAAILARSLFRSALRRIIAIMKIQRNETAQGLPDRRHVQLGLQTSTTPLDNHAASLAHIRDHQLHGFPDLLRNHRRLAWPKISIIIVVHVASHTVSLPRGFRPQIFQNPLRDLRLLVRPKIRGAIAISAQSS